MPTAPPLIPAAWDRPASRVELSIDVAERYGVATVTLLPGDSMAASFDIGTLEIEAVSSPTGALPWRREGATLHVWAPTRGEPVDVSIRYRFEVQDDGWLETGATRTWPYHCGNLFPCRPHPSEGLHYEVEIEGELPQGWVAVHPQGVVGPLPAYAAGWAIGPYAYVERGITAAGTRVGVWHLPNREAVALEGTEGLVDAFGWLEQTLGPYPYGRHVGAVEVVWAKEAYGAMEHHPYWHVETGSLGNPVTHAHEAAHGWFGDGVRLRCWEDIVLSEGLASYLAARAIGATQGSDAEAEVWATYRKRLEYAWRHEDRVAWPDTCGAVDVLRDGLFSETPYMKGAHFMRAVERAIGRRKMDEVLRAFVAAHMGQAAGVQDLLDTIGEVADFDATPLAERWLRSRGPVDGVADEGG